jgi:hypothetical protein
VSKVVQHFLWKACNNILPTKENLYKKRITEDSLCPLYNSVTETVGHILWSCESSKDVWAECCRSLQKCSNAEDGFPDILEKLASRLSEDEMQLAGRGCTPNLVASELCCFWWGFSISG